MSVFNFTEIQSNNWRNIYPKSQKPLRRHQTMMSVQNLLLVHPTVWTKVLDQPADIQQNTRMGSYSGCFLYEQFSFISLCVSSRGTTFVCSADGPGFISMQEAVWSSMSWKRGGPCTSAHLPVQELFYVVFCYGVFVFIFMPASKKSDNLQTQMIRRDSLVSVLCCFFLLYLVVPLLHWRLSLFLRHS